MQTLTISRLLRQGKEVSRRLRAGESFVLTRGHQLVGILKPIPSDTLARLEDVLHVNSAEFAAALEEACGEKRLRTGMTKVFARQVRAAVADFPAIAARIAEAGDVLQADRAAGSAVHIATTAPGFVPQLKRTHARIRKLRLACGGGEQDGAEALLYFLVPGRGSVILLALFVKTDAGDVGPEGHACIAEAIGGDGGGRG